MTHGTRLGVFVAGLMLIGANQASAQYWGRPRTPSAGACFYEDIEFGGRYFCARAGTSTTKVPSGTNDEISSIRIFGNAQVIVYRDPNFKGQSRRFDSNMPDLRNAGLNDRISSFRIESRYGGNWGGSPGSGGYNNGRWTYQQAQAMVRRAYLSVLGREPDPASRSYVDAVMKNNWNQHQLETELMKSPEYRDKRR
jgi:hypothetical protein